MICRSMLIAAPVALVSLAGCVTTDYVGASYAPTQKVDVFYHMSDVGRPHQVMGRARAEASDYLTYDNIQAELIKQAMAKGADAIVIGDMQTVAVAESGSTWGKGDGDPHYYVDKDGKLQKGGHDSWTSHSYTTEVKDKVITAELVKYQ